VAWAGLHYDRALLDGGVLLLVLIVVLWLWSWGKPAPKPAGTSIRLKTGPYKQSAFELGRDIERCISSARMTTERNRSTRAAEKAMYDVRALMVTLTKEKGISWPSEIPDPQLNLEAVLRIMERIAPLIKAGHDKEARDAANEVVNRLNRARDASASPPS
jgi:hypothetical protein